MQTSGSQRGTLDVFVTGLQFPSAPARMAMYDGGCSPPTSGLEQQIGYRWWRLGCSQTTAFLFGCKLSPWRRTPLAEQALLDQTKGPTYSLHPVSKNGIQVPPGCTWQNMTLFPPPYLFVSIIWSWSCHSVEWSWLVAIDRSLHFLLYFEVTHCILWQGVG